MTDDPRTPDDDLLRATLQSEAADVHADDALLARIRTATAPPSAWRRRTPLLAMAAAIVVVAGLAALLLGRDDETVVLEDPDPSGLPPQIDPQDLFCEVGDSRLSPPPMVTVVFMQPTSLDPAASDHEREVIARLDELEYGPVEHLQPAQTLGLVQTVSADMAVEASRQLPAAPNAFFVVSATPERAMVIDEEIGAMPGVWAILDVGCGEPTDTTVDPVPTSVVSDGDRPTLVALVREDGWLVTVDLETGEQRELHTEGDPQQAEPGLEEGGPYFIDAVDLSPDGQWIYFSTCCEPADGLTFRIPTEGGEVDEVGFGAYPRTSPDRGFVATAGSAHLRVYRIDDLGPGGQPAILEIGCCAKHLAWSPDGTELALVHGTGAEGETPQIRRFSWDGTTLAEVDMGKPDNPGWFVMWMPGGMLSISSGEPIADDRGRSQDASYEWILWVDEEGRIWEETFFDRRHQAIPGLPEALAADW